MDLKIVSDTLIMGAGSPTKCNYQASRTPVILCCENTSLDHFVELKWFGKDITKHSLNQGETGWFGIPRASRAGHDWESRHEISKNSLNLWISKTQNLLRVEVRMKMCCMIRTMNWNGRRLDVECTRVEKRLQI